MVFPAETKSGHIEGSTLKKQHAAALMASGVVPFVLYTLRHTCITRWAKHMDPFTLHVLAGHTDMNTTKRYVHPSEADILEAMEKVRGTYKVGHSLESAAPKKTVGVAAIQQERSGYVVHTPSFVASRWNTLVALGAVSRRTTEDIAVPKYLVVFGIRLGRAERTEEITIDCASEGLQQEASKRKREEEDLWNSENDTGKAINVRVVQVLPL